MVRRRSSLGSSANDKTSPNPASDNHKNELKRIKPMSRIITSPSLIRKGFRCITTDALVLLVPNIAPGISSTGPLFAL